MHVLIMLLQNNFTSVTNKFHKCHPMHVILFYAIVFPSKMTALNNKEFSKKTILRSN